MTPEERAAAVAAAVDLHDQDVRSGWAMMVEGEIYAAIRDAIAEEREACAKVAEEGSFLHNESPAARFGREVAAAIRRRK